MAKAGDIIDASETTGEKLIFHQTARDTGGKLLDMEVFVKPGGFIPPEHIHPSQEEAFRILDGTLRLRIDGVEQDLGPGEDATVPPGAAHTVWPVGAETVHFISQVRPALQFETFLETIHGLARDGKTDKLGRPNPLQMAVLLNAFKDELRLPSLPLRVLVAIIAPVGYLLGYRAVLSEDMSKSASAI